VTKGKRRRKTGRKEKRGLGDAIVAERRVAKRTDLIWGGAKKTIRRGEKGAVKRTKLTYTKSHFRKGKDANTSDGKN